MLRPFQPSPTSRRFLAFAALSGCGWLVDTAVTLSLAAGAHAPTWFAQCIGGAIAASGVYVVSRRSVFRGRGRATRGLGVYLAFSVAMIALAGIALAWTSGQIPRWITLPLGAQILLAKILITPPILGINYAVAGWLSSQVDRKSIKPSESSV